MDNYKSLYHLLFNCITDTIEDLYDLRIKLVRIQQSVEYHFIERSDTGKEEPVTEHALKKILQIVKGINDKNKL
ncbi:MAG: hypothetical protein FWE74_00285 [Oscillospiraceae bacterium]|nr:hypothetical protein [Oscillospiraceae bacterium]